MRRTPKDLVGTDLGAERVEYQGADDRARLARRCRHAVRRGAESGGEYFRRVALGRD